MNKRVSYTHQYLSRTETNINTSPFISHQPFIADKCILSSIKPYKSFASADKLLYLSVNNTFGILKKASLSTIFHAPFWYIIAGYNHSSETLLAAFDTSSAKLVVADSVSFIQEQAQFWFFTFTHSRNNYHTPFYCSFSGWFLMIFSSVMRFVLSVGLFH